jgi:outer membrane protein TolC
LENGTATTNDYLTAVNAQDQAQQNLLLHQIQLLMAQYNYQTTSGN